MADQQAHHDPLPVDLDPRDPQFPRKVEASNLRTKSDVMEIIAKTKETIARSKAILAEVHRVLAKR